MQRCQNQNQPWLTVSNLCVIVESKLLVWLLKLLNSQKKYPRLRHSLQGQLPHVASNLPIKKWNPGCWQSHISGKCTRKFWKYSQAPFYGRYSWTLWNNSWRDMVEMLKPEISEVWLLSGPYQIFTQWSNKRPFGLQHRHFPPQNFFLWEKKFLTNKHQSKCQVTQIRVPSTLTQKPRYHQAVQFFTIRTVVLLPKVVDSTNRTVPHHLVFWLTLCWGT